VAPDPAERRVSAIIVIALAALTAAAVAMLFWQHARGYFFLFDDFALIKIAGTEPASRLLAQPLIGFYRPLPFLLLRAEALTASWNAPATYAGMSLLVHVLNAALCAALTRTFRVPREAPMLAACLFLLSPWETEAFL